MGILKSETLKFFHDGMEEQCSGRVKLFIKLFYHIIYCCYSINTFFVYRKNNKNSSSQNRRASGGGNKKSNDTVEYFGLVLVLL